MRLLSQLVRYSVDCRHSALPMLMMLMVAGLMVPSLASAQGWLADRSRTEGPGIRVGDLELHPGIGVELGYDSNFFYEDQDPDGVAILRTTAHLNLTTLGEERSAEGERTGLPPVIVFSAGLSASYNAFFTSRAQDNVSGDADVRLTINPQRPFSFTLYDTFSRGIRPFVDAGALDGDYGQINNAAGVRLDFGTESNVFRGTLGYEFQLDFFEGESFAYANNLTHRTEGTLSWKFLPNTALLYDLRMDFSNYVNNSGGGLPLLSSSTKIRSRVGLNGSITNTISLTGMVGYHVGFYTAGDEFESIAAQVALKWAIAPTTNFTLGYDGDYYRAISGGFARRDRGHISLDTLIGGSFLIGAELSIANIGYGAQLAADGSPLGVGGVTDRSDIQFTAGLFSEYRITNWLGVNANIMYTGNFTDFVYIVPEATPPIDAAEYSKFEAWLGVRAFY